MARLTSGQRQKNQSAQGELAFPAESRSDAPKAAVQGTETLAAKRTLESLAGTERLMEAVCEPKNCKQALHRVKANKGSPGVDGMTVDELPEYLQQHGPEIGEQLLNGTYQPQPVLRVEIPKPDGSGMRKLGIPGFRMELENLVCDSKGKGTSGSPVSPKVPMRKPGADCSIGALIRGNSRGAKGAGHPH
jgi:hypothetical protein